MAYNNNRNGRGAQRPNGNYRSNNNRPSRPTFMDVLREKDSETLNLALIIRNSASLRRHVGLAIKQQIITAGKATSDDRVYVKFGLTHYTVRINGLGTDYPYSDIMCLRGVLASCISTTVQIQTLVNEFTWEKFNEPLSECDALCSEESSKTIQAIANDVIAHINEKVEEDND